MDPRLSKALWSTGEGSGADAYMPLMYTGAVSPQFVFDTSLARCSLQGLHTPYTESNGTNLQSPDQLLPNSTPEATTFGVSLQNSAIQSGVHLDLANGGSDTALGFDAFRDSSQKGNIIDSQSGLFLEFLEGYTGSDYVPLTAANEADSLLHKLGFSASQLSKQAVGSLQGRIGNPLPPSAAEQALLPLYPTTNAYVSSSEVQALSLNRQGAPLYDLAVQAGTSGTPTIESAGIIAIRPPSKLEDGYVMVHSDIVSTATKYLGGSATIDLPCVALVSRVDSSGDFTFTEQSTWSFTVLKQSVLTDIAIDVRRPDGRVAPLKSGSLILFKISRANLGGDALVRPNK
jgi:hypothetical protein